VDRLVFLSEASGAINSTIGKATSKLMPHLRIVAAVNTATIPLATIVLTAVTIPVMGNTNKKLCI
jgi:hypothetical protein